MLAGHITGLINAQQQHMDNRLLNLELFMQNSFQDMRGNLVTIESNSRAQLEQVARYLKRASTIQVTSTEQIAKRIDRLETALGAEDSKVIQKLNSVDFAVADLWEKSNDTLANSESFLLLLIFLTYPSARSSSKT